MWDLPNYGCLPDGEFKIDLKGTVGKFLAHYIFDLDDTQPIESKVMGLSKKLFDSLPVIGVNPSAKAITCPQEMHFFPSFT